MSAVLGYIRRLVAVEQFRAQKDQELLRRFVEDRDEAAFAALVERHGPLVWSACRRLLKSEQDAEDVLQATFLVFVRKAASLGQGSVGNWLYGVAYRLALKAWTQAVRRRSRERLTAETSRAQSVGPVTQNEWQCILDEELERLPEKYRAPILLCCLQGKSRDEAAQALGWSAGAVKIRLERGRELLRTRLARRGVPLSAALSVGLLANGAVAALPLRLTTRIVEAGMKFATNSELAGLVTPSVSSLVTGFLKGAAIIRIKILVGMLLAFSGVGVACWPIAGLLMVSRVGNLPAEEPTPGKVIRSARSGPWSDATTWEGGKVPEAGAKVLVRKGHVVEYDADAETVIRSLHIAGTVTFRHDKNTLLNVGLIKVQHGESMDEDGAECKDHPKKEEEAVSTKDFPPGFTAPCLCCDGKPALLVGTPEQPIAAKYVARIRLHYVNGMDKQTCPAIICCGGLMDFHGTPLSRSWVKLGASVPEPKKRQGDEGTVITLAEKVTGWKAGDRIIITATATQLANDHGPGSYRANAAKRGHQQYESQTEERIIKSIEGDRVTLDRPLDFAHRGEGEFRAEVANLSRNVVVESADPAGVRGHTMYHRKSAGSISYAEFRHLGKEGVLGRYALHYHLCGDTMRGSSVVGASIWDSHNRWLTIHGTQYLVVRDCVGYKSIGHGYFLEDGTEVYNVLDRNLAVHAYRGLPLPNQALPFDKNDGAGFWWANCLNTFVGNVACECDEYGYRFEAIPKAGVLVAKQKFGAPDKPFDLTLSVRQPNGATKFVDIRTLPFIRFDDNEVHGMNNYGLNLGEGNGFVGPDAKTPLVIRNFQAWQCRLAYRPAVPHVLIEKAELRSNTYGIYQPEYVGHDYRDVVQLALDGGPIRPRRLPGEARTGDGGGKVQPPAVEVAKLTPEDKLPPITVITHLRKEGDKLIVRGTTSDNGTVKQVLVNGSEAQWTAESRGEWQVVLSGVKRGPVAVSAHAADMSGNVEQSRHEMTVVVSE